MGGLVSRRKRTKVEAKSVSTQATECKDESQAAACQPEAATDALETEKATVTELNIGDCILPSSQLPKHEVSVERRASTENKKRRGLSKVKIRPKSGKKTQTQGVDFSTQYDYLGIPGQVSPSFRSPISVNSVEKKFNTKTRVRSPQDQPDESAVFDLPIPDSERKKEGANPLQGKTNETQTSLDTQSPRKEAVVDNNAGEEDENSNIVKEGTLLAELRNRELYGGCTDDELSFLHGDSNEPPPSSAAHSPDHSSPHKPRKKSVSYTDGCKTAAAPEKKILSGAGKEFKLSLEEIFQSTLPCHAEVMEVAAVTGTSGTRQTRPPNAGYEISWNDMVRTRYQTHWNVGVKMGGAGVDRGSEAENADPKKVRRGTDSGAGGCSQQEQGAARNDDDDADDDNDGCQGDDIAEDTLDWNVDDRVRSPTDSRTNSINSSDNDDNVDLLTNCTIDVVATSAGQRQSSLTTLKDGDSAGGSIYSPPSQSPRASARGSLGKGSTKVRTGHEKSQGQQGQNSASEADGLPASATRPDADRAADGTDAGGAQDRPEDVSQGTTPANRATVPPSEPDKIVMSLGDKTKAMGGERMSLLAMQEAEAMTLLLLTGTLPGEDGGGVIRGAGDAQNLDSTDGTGRADENREANERAGLASMLDAQSKSSCQLEQLQLQQNQTESCQSFALHDEQPPQNGQTTSDDGTAAGAETTCHPPDQAPQSATTTQAEDSGSALDGAPGIGRGSADAAAAGSLAGEDENKPPSAERVSSPGAASPEGDWQVIPLHRVPGQTDLGGGSAVGTSATAPELDNESSQPAATAADPKPSQGQAKVESNVPGEGQAAESICPVNESLSREPPLQRETAKADQLRSNSSGEPGQQLQPSPRSHDTANVTRDNGGESKVAEEETAASSEVPKERAGTGNSPKQKRSVVTLKVRAEMTVPNETDTNQSANTPSTSTPSSTADPRPSPTSDGPERSGSSRSQREMERQAGERSRRQASAAKVFPSSPTNPQL